MFLTRMKSEPEQSPRLEGNGSVGEGEVVQDRRLQDEGVGLARGAGGSGVGGVVGVEWGAAWKSQNTKPEKKERKKRSA